MGLTQKLMNKGKEQKPQERIVKARKALLHLQKRRKTEIGIRACYNSLVADCDNKELRHEYT